ncbi:MAG: T9SS type A sorting domain-containing protein [Chitinophagaceae bacterium]
MTNKLTIIFLAVLLLCYYQVAALQKKWAGPVAGDWENASNWQPTGIPTDTDDIILDNSIQKNSYVIVLPVTTVNVYTLLIEPTDGYEIELNLPASNKSSPGFIVNETGNSFNIKKGGIFINSSGLTAGSSIQLNGLLSIYNEGRYIHNSRSSHATDVVAKLSVAAGTEKGIFEFDVPGGSYPISFSGRVYGTLILSSAASGSSQTYNASGSNPAIINGGFEVNDGVQFNLDLTKDMIIYGDYIQRGGIFNVASQPNNNVIKIKGSVYQSGSGIITETSGGLPALELCGEVNQQVSFAGNIVNDVALKINNSKGIILSSPLKLSYKLLLTEGTLKTSLSNLLTISDNGIASGGSEASFIDGPVKKIGDDDFEFPVGKQGDYAPVKITGSGGAVTDECLAEYFLANPELAFGPTFENPPVVRISKLEYWSVERLSGSSSKNISVFVGKYSNATDLAKLVLVRWDAGNHIWKNEGNTFYLGIAIGTITSNDVSSFGAFTIGSTVQSQNPLPVPVIGPGPLRIQDSVSRAAPFIKIFPSVVRDQLFLRVVARKKELMRVVITDVNGRTIMVLNFTVVDGLNTIPVQLSTLTNGIYFITLYSNSGMYGSTCFVKR